MEQKISISHLTSDQQKQFKQLIKSVTPDQQTQKLSINYFVAFKRQMGYISPEKLTIAIKCAYFMAQKSQVVRTVSGQQVAGYSLSLNQFLQNHKLDDILITLKEFTKRVKISDAKASQQLNYVIEQISFLIKMVSKFESVFNSLELIERRASQFDYLKSFRSFAWLLFIETKRQVLKQSLQLIQNTCLMAQTICYILLISWDHVKPLVFMNSKVGLSETSSWKQIKYKIKQKTLEKFYIKDLQIFKHIAIRFEQNFNKMMNNGVIKGQIVQKGQSKMFDCCSPDFLSANYQRLDSLYRKSLNYNDLDQRIFIRDRPNTLTPSKFTPFAKQGYVNKVDKVQQKRQVFTSHRILNYERIQQEQNTSKTQTFASMKIPKSVVQKSSITKVPLLCQTPISNGMQMFNYLNEKVKKLKNNKIEPFIDNFLFQIFQKDNRQYDKTSKIHKRQLISGLYIISLTQFQSLNPGQQICQSLKKAILGLATQIVFFVSNINIGLETIQQVLSLQTMLQWRACDFFLNSDKNLPLVLKLHLLDIQVQIVSSKIWKQTPIIQAVKQCANDQCYRYKGIQRLLKRILHQTAYQIANITSCFDIEQSVSQQIFQTMKQILINSTFLLQNFHLDQFILSCIFVNCKIRAKNHQKYRISFAEMIEKYQQNNPNNKKMHESIIYKIDAKKSKPITIVQFYNQIIISQIKLYLRERDQQTNKENAAVKIKKRNLALQSPLTNIIPKEVIHKQTQRDFQKSIKKITHQTSMLMAYNQSPMLKYGFGAAKVPINSRKVIDFDQQQEKILNNLGQKQQIEDDFKASQSTKVLSKIFNLKKSSNYNSHQIIQKAQITCNGGAINDDDI